MTSEVVVVIFELMCVITIGLCGGLYFSWQAAVLCFICSPIMIVGMYLMSTMSFGNKGGRHNGDQAKIDDYARSNALLSDVIINYRTVISFGQKNVNRINERFVELLSGPLDEKIS